MAAPPLPLKVAGKVKLLAGTPKLPSFAQSLLLEIFELDELENVLETLLTLDDEEFEDELLTLDNEELEETLLTLDREELEEELLKLEDEELEEELLRLDREEFEDKLLPFNNEELEEKLLTLEDEGLDDDVLAPALEVKMLSVDEEALVATELLEFEVATRLDTLLEDEALLDAEDALLGDVVADGVKPESLVPPPPPPHAVNTNIITAGVSSLNR